jgi:hypothetical protein
MLRNSLLVLVGVSMMLASTVTARQTTASDLTGTWTGTIVFNGDTPDDDPALLKLTQKGAELTGTGGPGESQQWKIVNGKVVTTKEGVSATFSLDTGSATIAFDVKLVDSHLKGSLKAQRGTETRTGTIDVTRAK